MANQMDLKIISTFSAMASCIQLLEQAAVRKVLLRKQARCAFRSRAAARELLHYVHMTGSIYNTLSVTLYSFY